MLMRIVLTLVDVLPFTPWIDTRVCYWCFISFLFISHSRAQNKTVDSEINRFLRCMRSWRGLQRRNLARYLFIISVCSSFFFFLWRGVPNFIILAFLLLSISLILRFLRLRAGTNTWPSHPLSPSFSRRHSVATRPTCSAKTFSPISSSSRRRTCSA
jgi:hypothetical protein